MGLSDFMASADAQSNVVTFGRDMSMAEPTTMTITENGTYDVRKKATVIVDIDANPNYKEVLTGTANKLEAPDGLANDIGNGDATAYIKLDVSALGLPVSSLQGPLQASGSSSKYVFSQFVAGANLAASLGFDIEWSKSDGTGQSAKGLMGGNLTDMSAYLAAVPYELTIYHHKMPEEP